MKLLIKALGVLFGGLILSTVGLLLWMVVEVEREERRVPGTHF